MQPYNLVPLKGSSRQPARHQANKPAHRTSLILLAVIISLLLGLRLSNNHANAASPVIRSGITGYCLDDYKNSLAPNNMVSAWQCNSSSAQAWSIKLNTIAHGSNTCLTVKNNATSQGSVIVASNCAQAPGQIWLRDASGYYNPNSKLCLAAPNNDGRKQLIVDSCQGLGSPAETWTSDQKSATCSSSDARTVSDARTEIACMAAKEWTSWQANNSNHATLLNKYTDSAPYEEWCADFISYVYKEAGHPLTGAYDGWDENNANNLQNYNFTQHMASSGYIPKPGDIAYFDYNGGHVELVISGGKNPTFIYGNSATVDPSTGNGQMEANTTTHDGAEGQLLYYLSPQL